MDIPLHNASQKEDNAYDAYIRSWKYTVGTYTIKSVASVGTAAFITALTATTAAGTVASAGIAGPILASATIAASATAASTATSLAMRTGSEKQIAKDVFTYKALGTKGWDDFFLEKLGLDKNPQKKIFEELKTLVEARKIDNTDQDTQEINLQGIINKSGKWTEDDREFMLTKIEGLRKKEPPERNVEEVKLLSELYANLKLNLYDLDLHSGAKELAISAATGAAVGGVGGSVTAAISPHVPYLIGRFATTGARTATSSAIGALRGKSSLQNFFIAEVGAELGTAATVASYEVKDLFFHHTNKDTAEDASTIRRLTEVGGSGSDVSTLDYVYNSVRRDGDGMPIMDVDVDAAKLKSYLAGEIGELDNAADCEKWLYILFKSYNGESGPYKYYENHDNDLCRSDIDGTKNLLEIIYGTEILRKLVEHHKQDEAHLLCNHYNQIRQNVGNPDHTDSITPSGDEVTFSKEELKDAKAAFHALLKSITIDEDNKSWNIEKYREFEGHLKVTEAKEEAEKLKATNEELKKNLEAAKKDAKDAEAAKKAADAAAEAAEAPAPTAVAAAFGAGAAFGATTTTAFALKSRLPGSAPTDPTAVQDDGNSPFVKIQDNSPAIGIIKKEGEKKVFYKGNINDITKVKNIHSYIYAEGKEVVNGILKKEVNIVRHNDMGYLIIKDKRLEDKDISIKIDFSGEKPTLSLINQEGQIIGINYEVKEILNSITINIHDKVETKNVTVKNIAGETEAKKITNPEDNINRINREINELQQSQSLQSFGGKGIFSITP